MVISNNGLKFVSAEPELLLQRGPVSGQDINCFQSEVILRVLREAHLLPRHDMLNNRVYQKPTANHFHLLVGQFSLDKVALRSLDRADALNRQVFNSLQHAVLNGVGNAGVIGYLDGMVSRFIDPTGR